VPDRQGSLTCDDFSGYKALIASGVSEVGCLAHARRKFFDLHASSKSQIAGFALKQFARVNEIEREVKDMDAVQRQEVRQHSAKPVLDALHQWMTGNYPWTTTGLRTRSALLPLGAATGCLLEVCAPVSGPLQ
jgi:hypothetical protein